MNRTNLLSLLLLLAALAVPAPAKVDLVTLPTRDAVQLTIYNSADLTLVRETRLLTLKKGANRLQFSWANTLIDPTSLELIAKAQAEQLVITDLDYPPRATNVGVWTIQSQFSGKVPMEITYLTSGLAWRAFYLGVLAKDEKSMRLEGYVRVTNASGEDYENAQTRLLVGTVHLLDEIAALARQPYPYGRPGEILGLEDRRKDGEDTDKSVRRKVAGFQSGSGGAAPARPKEIVKEGLSEYFLYTIEGTETIPTGWSKRLPSFDKNDIPVVNLYKYEEERFGKAAVRFLSFKNDKAHQLGETPIPGGLLRVFRQTGEKAGVQAYEGQSEFKYIPVDQEVELNLGAVDTVIVEPTLMDFRTDNFQLDNAGNISGWDETRAWKVEVKNTRPVPAKVEVKRHFPVPRWELEKQGECGDYEKVNLDTVKFTLTLDPRGKKEFQYTVTTHHGSRAQ